MSAEPIGAHGLDPEPGHRIDPYRPAPLGRPRPRAVTDPPRPREDTRPRPRILPPTTPEAWASTIVVALTEVLSGARPVQQLNRWLAPDLYARLARRAGLAARINGRAVAPPRAHLLGVRLSEPVALEHEVSAAVHDGTRVRAIALRIRRSGERWQVLEAEIG